MQRSKKVEIKSGLKNLKDGSFGDCNKLKEASLCNGLTTIGEYVFFGTAIEKLSVPYSVTKIGESTFASCAKLKEVHLSKNLPKISTSLFKDCVNLKSLVIPANVKIIEKRHF